MTSPFHFIVKFTTCATAILMLSGCQPAVYLMPTPAAYQTGKFDPFANTPESERGSSILIGYATNRLPIGSKQSRFYGTKFDETIRMGVAEVQIGSGEKSWEEIRNLSFEDSRNKVDSLLTLANATEMYALDKEMPIEQVPPELSDLMKRLNAAIEASASKDLTIYVHGANNSFYRTAAQAAQYRHFSGRQPIVVLFSWPSAESILRYGTDIRHINQTVPTFVRYIKFLAKHTSARKINILAYSAGATLTTKSLAALGRDESHKDRDSYRQSLRLGAIYFAAPDTDFDEFVGEYRSYQDLVDSVTVTVNQYDTVLGISREEHKSKNQPIVGFSTSPSGKSRLGKPDLSDITAEDAEWLARQTREAQFYVIDIEPGSIPNMTRGSHDYWYQNAWASTDALIDLNLHIPPQDRGLVLSEDAPGANIWKFPDDYGERIGQRVNDIIQELRKNSDIDQLPQ